MTRSPADILKHVAQIGGGTRWPGTHCLVSLLRRAAIKLLRSDAGLPFAQIAKIFGPSWSVGLPPECGTGLRPSETGRSMPDCRFTRAPAGSTQVNEQWVATLQGWAGPDPVPFWLDFSRVSIRMGGATSRSAPVVLSR